MFTFQGYPGANRRSLAKPADNIDPAAEKIDSLAHACMAQTSPGAMLGSIKAAAIIGHG
jgi:hypothetical protein